MEPTDKRVPTVEQWEALADKIAGAGGIKTLTTEDYNWPLTGDKTAVHPGLLPDGIYLYDGSVNIWAPKIDGVNVSLLSNTPILTHSVPKYSTNCFMFISGGYGTQFFAEYQYSSNGSCSRELYINGIINNLTTEQGPNKLFPLSSQQGAILNRNIGNLTALTTTAKTSTVAAINELVARVAALEGN